MNVIVICMDTLRADVVEHTWEDDVSTPNLDRLRESSVVFTNCYGEAEPTIPMRKGCFTGRRGFPWNVHIDDTGSFPNLYGWHAIPPEQPTLAETAVAAGVCTGLVTDVWHYFKATMNYIRGFAGYTYIRGQEADTTRTGPISAVLPLLKRHLPDELATPTKAPGMVKYLLNVLDRRGEEDYFAAQVFRTAAQWLRDNMENQPFLLWVDSFTPHECWDPPTYYADRYFKKPGVRDYIYPQHVQGRKPFTEDEIRRTKALYYGYVTFADRWIGHFLQTLEDVGLAQNTAILFTSDHGTELYDKGRFGKSARALHAYNTRLNCWLHVPGGPTGSCEALVQNHDFFPTILNWLGVPHEPVDGTDLWPIATGKAGPPRDCVITGWMEWASVRTTEWNLIVNTTAADPQPRLYQVQEDPKEERNLAEKHPDQVKRLLRHLEALLGGPLPARYVHQPKQQGAMVFNRWVQQWHESNLAR